MLIDETPALKANISASYKPICLRTQRKSLKVFRLFSGNKVVKKKKMLT
jgi:hypothetical protein